MEHADEDTARQKVLFDLVNATGIPIARPMLASVAIIVFFFSWNEFLVAFVLSARNAQTVSVAVASLASAMTFDWTLISALADCSMIPAMLFVGFAQRHIVSGLGTGAVK